MALDLRAFGLQGGGGGMSMPTMPGMPSFTLAPGGGGPATSDGQASASSAFDASGWAINFAGEQSATSTPTTMRNGYEASTGLPVRAAVPIPGIQTMRGGPTAGQTGGIVLSPLLIGGAALVLVLVMRRR